MKQTSRRTHLSRQMEQQTKRTILVSSLGSIALITGLILLGPKIISSMSLLVQSNDTSTSSNSGAHVIVTSPILDPLPISTNSARLIVSGQAQKDRQIKLFVNDTKMGTQDTDSDGSFRFTNVKLSEGDNEVRAVSISGDTESNSSRSQTVRYISKAPELTVDSPTDDQEIHGGDRKVTVSGKSDPGVQISVNGVFALSNTDGSFSFTLAIQEGDNTITISATDDAGNHTDITRHVKYIP